MKIRWSRWTLRAASGGSGRSGGRRRSSSSWRPRQEQRQQQEQPLLSLNSSGINNGEEEEEDYYHRYPSWEQEGAGRYRESSLSSSSSLSDDRDRSDCFNGNRDEYDGDRDDMMDASSRIPRSPAPRLIFLFATLTLTVAATVLLCGAIMSDHWEEVYWDREILDRLNVSPGIRWYLDDRVGKLDSEHNNRPRVDEDHRVVQTIGNAAPPPPAQRQRSHSVVDAAGVHSINKNNNEQNSAPTPAFIVPMHGGIWTLCVSLTDLEIELLGQVDFPQERCINYLKPDEAHEELRAAWQNRENYNKLTVIKALQLTHAELEHILLAGLSNNPRLGRHRRLLRPLPSSNISRPHYRSHVSSSSDLRALHSDDPLQQAKRPGSQQRRRRPSQRQRARGRRGRWARRSTHPQGPSLRLLLVHGLRLGWRHPVRAGLDRLDSPEQDHEVLADRRYDSVAARGLRGLRRILEITHTAAYL
uniref:Uncharacterized protein n=1 Tax=Trichogramma kaykai TaxID=54128 RepID=A0ABD2VZL0_9HYME